MLIIFIGLSFHLNPCKPNDSTQICSQKSTPKQQTPKKDRCEKPSVCSPPLISSPPSKSKCTKEEQKDKCPPVKKPHRKLTNLCPTAPGLEVLLNVSSIQIEKVKKRSKCNCNYSIGALCV